MSTTAQSMKATDFREFSKDWYGELGEEKTRLLLQLRKEVDDLKVLSNKTHARIREHQKRMFSENLQNLKDQERIQQVMMG